MKVGMIQSNYIPWRGYFDFIDDVELFVFYDDVQYTHRDWRNRNRIKTANGLIWLSVPVIHGSHTLIRDAAISYKERWTDKHIRSIAHAYAASPYYRQYADEFFDILNMRLPTISDLNVAICRWAMTKLGISTRTILASEIDAVGDKFDRPVTMLKKLGATAYLSGPAAKPYTDPQLFRDAHISLEYKSYEYSEYPQLHGKFEPFVSILDLLFNTGPAARSHLKSVKENERVL